MGLKPRRSRAALYQFGYFTEYMIECKYDTKSFQVPILSNSVARNLATENDGLRSISL